MRVLYFEVDFYNDERHTNDVGIINWNSVKWVDDPANRFALYRSSKAGINSRGFWGYASSFKNEKGDYVKETTWLDPITYDGTIKNANIILRKFKLLKINNE